MQNDPTFNGTAFIMDVTKASDIKNAKRIIENQVDGKGLWGLINNAGIVEMGLIEWQSIDKMQHVMNVNVWGAVNVTKAMLPLVKQAKGRIVNITSMAGRVVLLNVSSYSMSKYALEAFSGMK